LANQNSDGFSYIFAPLLTAWSYAAEGDFPAAELALASFNDDKRLKPLAQEHAAYMLDYLGEYDAAKARYKQVTSKMPPVSLQPAVAYAHLLYRHGEKKQALSFLAKQAMRFDNPPFLLRQGRIIASGGKPSNIATTPLKAGGAIFFRLANELSQGRSQKAAILYARIASYLTPDHSNVHILLARLLESTGNVTAAADALAQVGETNEARGYADIRRVEVLQAAGQNVLAEKLTRELLVKAPRNPQLLLGLGDLLRLRQADAESLVYYNRAVSSLGTSNELNWVAYFARAMVYEKLGDWPRAEQDLETALQISPDEPTLLNYLGYSWIDRGAHIVKAKIMIEKAAAIKPNDGFITDSLGWVYFLTADYSAAVTTLEKAVRLEPGDVTINDHLGDAYWKVGRRIEARFQWRHALDNGAKDKERALILAKLDTGLLEAS
ncbi:MAG: tetratricopeptide repeat protein, partial [Kordiimonadaceae bacterium]|nr:tetratricopeptide repeat protein [Kordiimonadaceae bacterium]